MRRTLTWSLSLIAFLLVAADQKAPFKKFQSRAGRFSVLLPGKPKLNRQKTGNITIVMYSLQLGGDTGYMAAYGDLPINPNEDAATIQTRLDKAVESAATSQNGKIIEQGRIKLDGEYHGRELVIAAPNGNSFLKGRVYLIKGRMYQVMVTGSRTFIASADVRRFLNSFALADPIFGE